MVQAVAWQKENSRRSFCACRLSSLWLFSGLLLALGICDLGRPARGALSLVGLGGPCMEHLPSEQPANIVRDYFGTSGSERRDLMPVRSEIALAPRQARMAKRLIL
jgi:hypothetical protein